MDPRTTVNSESEHVIDWFKMPETADSKQVSHKPNMRLSVAANLTY
jgi:hypothetical protein